MENIKKKFASLKDEISKKKELIQDLQDKLKTLIEVREDQEMKRQQMSGKLEHVEDELDDIQDRLSKASSILQETQHDSEDKASEVKKLKNSEALTSHKLIGQNEELRSAKEIAEEADFKYEELARQLVVMDAQLEKAEADLENSSRTNKELKAEIHELSLSAKSYKAMETSCRMKEDKQTDKIALLEKQLEESEFARDAAEKLLRRLNDCFLESERNLELLEVDRDDAKKELEEMLNEVNNY